MPQAVHLRLSQQIVDTLKSICDHDINYIDPQGCICASTDPSRVGGYHEGGREAARTGQTITIAQDDPARELRRGINMPIRHNGQIVAVIGITGEPQEVQRFAVMAQRLTLLLLHEQELDLSRRGIRAQTDYLVRALIRGDELHPAFLQEVLAQNGIRTPPERWRTVVFQIREGTHTPALASLEAALDQAFAQLPDSLSAFCYPDAFVLITRAENTVKYAYVLRGVAQTWSAHLRIGVGSRRSLRRQHLSYQSALIAIQSLAPDACLGYFEDLDLEILLSTVPNNAVEAYLARVLAGLDAEDRALLDRYFSNDRALEQTASQLFIHKNTLQYRLSRIHARTGYDPRRFRDGVVLFTALHLDRLRGSADPARSAQRQ